MAAWRKNNPARAREHWRTKYWKKKGFPGFRGVALGGKDVTPEIRQRYHHLCALVHRLAYEYYIWAAPTVSDAEYDRLFDELKQIEKDHPELADPNSPTVRVGCSALSTFAKVAHQVPMLSLDKATTAEEVAALLGGHQGVIEPKVDGCSLSIRYVKGRLVQALTRGNGREGDDVTHNARTIRTIPLWLKKPLTIEVRGEVYMKYSDFAKMNEALAAAGEELAANPRNSASGALKLKDSKECAKVPLNFMACHILEPVEGYATQDAVLELLEELGFATTSALPLPIEECTTMFQSDVNLGSVPDIKEHIDNLDTSRKLQDFPTDGLVFKINDLAVQRELGNGTTAPRWAVAFKYPPEQVETRITQIEFTVGKTGKVTPVAILEPVLISGSQVSRASLCNGDELRRLKVDVGDSVLVEKSNEIIPKVVRVTKKHTRGKIAQMPTECPDCGAQLVPYEGMVDIFCVNPACTGQVEARMRYATGKQALDIDGCGEQTVKLLIQGGIHTLGDLFAATDFPYLKPAARKKLLAGRELALKAPFHRKLIACGIEGWGVQTCQDITQRFPSFDQLVDASDTNAIEPVPGIGPVRAASLRNYLQTWAEELVRLAELGFWKVTKRDQIENPAIRGKTFCITGGLPDCSREQAHAEILKRGGLVKSSVSRQLNYLVVGDAGGQNKASAALRWGTVCLTPEEFFKMMDWFPVAVNPEREH